MSISSAQLCLLACAGQCNVVTDTGGGILNRGVKMGLIFALYVLLVIFVSLVPGEGISLWHIDKIGHFLAYAGMAVLAFLTFDSGRARISALVFAVALGAALEWGQSFVPGRDMSLLDGIANTLGVLAGTLLFRRCRGRIRMSL
jgi:VanZ family protein